MLLSDFDFHLPNELIAQEALPKGTSRMLVVRPGEGAPGLEHRRVHELVSLLGKGDVVVVNDTKVIPARLFAEPLGNMTRKIEVFLTRHTSPLVWECWCKPAKRVSIGDVLRFSDALQAVVRRKSDDGFVIEFHHVTPAGVWSEIERLGIMPLPPYIRREEARAEDREAYQTVYADRAGAIAAPTAGLHFTREMLAELERTVELVHITLHVGVGTFKPVKVENVSDHRMDPEWYDISPEAAAQLPAAKREGRRVVAIGTTTVRTLESAAEEDGSIVPGSRETSIFITPGYSFRVVDALLTNFHLPQSTLLMLVSAFAGRETIKAAYAEAVKERYRFYSFGDCMFLTNRGSW
jgi:S-adenosylmethionine:tRNA ribosyltransferase-isomerase